MGGARGYISSAPVVVVAVLGAVVKQCRVSVLFGLILQPCGVEPGPIPAVTQRRLPHITE